jgi:L-alanine-DL-glutamate epimerase-like enolase superfamily enzyme
VREPVRQLDGLDALEQWTADHAEEIDANPSAFCAVELALLDLFARQRGESIEEMLGIEPLTSPLRTSAVYGTGGWPKFAAQMFLFRWNGMRDAKLKLVGRAKLDARRAALLALGARVRLDANNLWKDVDRAVEELTPVARHAWAVEEPVQPRDWRGMAEVGARTGLDLVVDESFTRLQDLDALPGPNFIPNFRISKLGGLLRSLSSARHALAAGRTIIIGAQVGETSILARAGIALAAFVGANLAGFEGCYGVRLLARDVTTPTLGFGAGGEVDLATASLGRHGLGLQPAAGFPAG